MSIAFQFQKIEGEMSLLVESYPLESHEAQCLLVNDEPTVEIGGKQFKTVPELLSAYPQIGSNELIDTYCKLANFLFTGVLYTYIDDPEAFMERYDRQTEEAEKTASASNPPFGPFCIDEIQKPHIEGGELIFYVEDTYNRIPYRVRAAHPYQKNSDRAQYELLERK